MSFLRPVAVLAALALGAMSCSKTESVPAPVHAPFSDLTYEQGLERARADDRVLLLDFTATWCPPCKAMEETTWPDPDVKAWIEREAVALQIDVDHEVKITATFGVRSMPTIVFVGGDGRELGRFVGYRDAAGFLAEAARVVPE